MRHAGASVTIVRRTTTAVRSTTTVATTTIAMTAATTTAATAITTTAATVTDDKRHGASGFQGLRHAISSAGVDLRS